MPTNRYTENEIILCTYAALYDADDFGGEQRIDGLAGRTRVSVSSKIRNFAALLDKKNVRRFNTLSPLTGRPKGEEARETDWDVVEPLTRVPKGDLLNRCRALLLTAQKS